MAHPFRTLNRIGLFIQLLVVRMPQEFQQFIDHGVITFFGFIDRQLRLIVSQHVFWVYLVHPTASNIIRCAITLGSIDLIAYPFPESGYIVIR